MSSPLNGREQRINRANHITKFTVVCLLNVLAVVASFIFFYTARSAAVSAYTWITDSATNSTFHAYPESCCATHPKYKPLPLAIPSGGSLRHDEGQALEREPKRVCTGAHISYFTFGPTVDDSGIFSCSMPLNVTDNSALADVVQAMATCEMIRYLSEDLPGVGYQHATSNLSSLLDVPFYGKQPILDYYFLQNVFDFIGAQFFPSRCFDKSHDANSIELGKVKNASIIPGTLELLTLQHKSVWFEILFTDTSVVSCSPLPEAAILQRKMTCLAGLLTTLTMPQEDGSQSQCKHPHGLLNGSYTSGAVLSFQDCKQYSCFDDGWLNEEYYSQFNDQVALVQRHKQFPYLGFTLLWEDLNNIYIALMGVFCVTLLTACITIVVSSTNFWHHLPILGTSLLESASSGISQVSIRLAARVNSLSLMLHQARGHRVQGLKHAPMPAHV